MGCSGVYVGQVYCPLLPPGLKWCTLYRVQYRCPPPSSPWVAVVYTVQSTVWVSPPWVAVVYTVQSTVWVSSSPHPKVGSSVLRSVVACVPFAAPSFSRPDFECQSFRIQLYQSVGTKAFVFATGCSCFRILWLVANIKLKEKNFFNNSGSSRYSIITHPFPF